MEEEWGKTFAQRRGQRARRRQALTSLPTAGDKLSSCRQKMGIRPICMRSTNAVYMKHRTYQAQGRVNRDQLDVHLAKRNGLVSYSCELLQDP